MSVYTTRADYDTAAGAIGIQTITDFNSFLFDQPLSTSMSSLGDLSASYAGITFINGHSAQLIDAPPFEPPPLNVDGSPFLLIIAAPDGSRVSIDPTTGGGMVRGFAFDHRQWGDAFNVKSLLEIETTLGTFVYEPSPGPTIGPSAFTGFITAPGEFITGWTWKADALGTPAGVDGLGVDNISILRHSSTSVPENLSSAAFAMVCIGLLGLKRLVAPIIETRH